MQLSLALYKGIVHCNLILTLWRAPAPSWGPAKPLHHALLLRHARACVLLLSGQQHVTACGRLATQGKPCALCERFANTAAKHTNWQLQMPSLCGSLPCARTLPMQTLLDNCSGYTLQAPARHNLLLTASAAVPIFLLFPSAALDTLDTRLRGTSCGLCSQAAPSTTSVSPETNLQCERTAGQRWQT